MNTILVIMGIAIGITSVFYMASTGFGWFHCGRVTQRFYGRNADGRIVSVDRRCRSCGFVIAGTCIAPVGVECGHRDHL